VTVHAVAPRSERIVADQRATRRACSAPSRSRAILSVGSDFDEVCDECGFHGSTLDLPAAVARIARSQTDGLW
jgi:hypothetical protein